MINITQHINTIKLLLAAMLTLLMAACSTDGREPTAIDSQAVSFSPGFARVITRSTLDNEWANETQIVVCCSEEGKDDKKYIYQYDASENKWTATSAASKYYWPINDPSWTFSAWLAGYGDSPKTTMTVAADQSLTGITETDYEGYDLLYCPPISATYRQPVTLNFLHQMARVKVIVNSSNTDNKETVTNITYGGGHVGLTGNIETQATSSANALWTVSGSQNSTITMRNRTTTTEASSNQYTFECILPPQSYTQQTPATLITITTTCTEYPTRTYNYSSNFSLAAGNQYTYSISISESGKIVVSTVQVTPWTSVTVNGTGNYPDNNYPSTTVTE